MPREFKALKHLTKASEHWLRSLWLFLILAVAPSTHASFYLPPLFAEAEKRAEKRSSYRDKNYCQKKGGKALGQQDALYKNSRYLIYTSFSDAVVESFQKEFVEKDSSAWAFQAIRRGPETDNSETPTIGQEIINKHASMAFLMCAESSGKPMVVGADGKDFLPEGVAYGFQTRDLKPALETFRDRQWNAVSRGSSFQKWLNETTNFGLFSISLNNLVLGSALMEEIAKELGLKIDEFKKPEGGYALELLLPRIEKALVEKIIKVAVSHKIPEKEYQDEQGNVSSRNLYNALKGHPDINTYQVFLIEKLDHVLVEVHARRIIEEFARFAEDAGSAYARLASLKRQLNANFDPNRVEKLNEDIEAAQFYAEKAQIELQHRCFTKSMFFPNAKEGLYDPNREATAKDPTPLLWKHLARTLSYHGKDPSGRGRDGNKMSNIEFNQRLQPIYDYAVSVTFCPRMFFEIAKMVHSIQPREFGTLRDYRQKSVEKRCGDQAKMCHAELEELFDLLKSTPTDELLRLHREFY